MNQREMNFLRESAEEAIRVGCEEEGLLRDEIEVELTLCGTLHSKTQSPSRTVVVAAVAALTRVQKNENSHVARNHDRIASECLPSCADPSS